MIWKVLSAVVNVRQAGSENYTVNCTGIENNSSSLRMIYSMTITRSYCLHTGGMAFMRRTSTFFVLAI